MIDYVRSGGVQGFARIVCRALRDNVDDSAYGDWTEVTSGWFCSDVLFDNALPRYLNGQDIFGSENDFVYICCNQARD